MNLCTSAAINYAVAGRLLATAAEILTLSSNRKVQGDGNCGWRGKLLPHGPSNAPKCFYFNRSIQGRRIMFKILDS